MRIAIYIVLAALVAISQSAAAESLELGIGSYSAAFNVKEHFLVSSRADSADPTIPTENLFMNEANVRAEVDRFSLGVILSNRAGLDIENQGSNRPFVLEKKSATFETENWQVRAGDSHQQLGRGIALDLFRDDVFGLDNTVEGGSIRYNPGPFDIGVFGGRLRSLQAPVALIPFQDPLLDREVVMAGGYAKGYVLEDAQVGGHYLLTLNRFLEDPEPNKRFHTVGALVQIDGIADEIDVYAEGNALVTQQLDGSIESPPTGFGNYVSAVYAPLPWKFKVELKDYRQFNFDFQRPPAVEEDIVQTLNFSDVTATRFWVERRLGSSPKNLVRASLLTGTDRVYNTSVNHGVVAAQWTAPAKVDVQTRAGYRDLPGQNNLAHGDLVAKVPTLRGQSLELGYRKLYGNNNLDFLPTEDDRNYFSLTYTFSSKWNLTLGYEYVPSNSITVGNHFYNAGTRLQLGDLLARAFVGQTSGGPQCSGGICRQVPAYSGAMLDCTYVF